MAATGYGTRFTYKGQTYRLNSSCTRFIRADHNEEILQTLWRWLHQRGWVTLIKDQQLEASHRNGLQLAFKATHEVIAVARITNESDSVTHSRTLAARDYIRSKKLYGFIAQYDLADPDSTKQLDQLLTEIESLK